MPGPSKKRPLFDPLTSSDDDDGVDVQPQAQHTGRKRAKSAATASSGSEPTKARRISAGEGMSNIATSMDSAAETLAGALAGVAQKMCSASTSDTTTNALAGALVEVVNAIRPPTLSATTPITDPRSAAMVIIEREEGFSDEDLACAARCIVASAELATTYVALKSQGACTALIRGAMEMHQSSK
ncbi:hypothetical protein BJY52DRAFT_1193230 [Lactarius psammicola]|nr:hypothetical protein BJY52DRAFT_1193230 [Lactarius psammicola]